jgi:hypothetical protein
MDKQRIAVGNVGIGAMCLREFLYDKVLNTKTSKLYTLDHKNVSDENKLQDVQNVYDRLYDRVNNMTKIKLKCWLFYYKSCIESKEETIFGFTTFKRYTTMGYYIDMVNSLTIDCTDLGGQEAGIKIIYEWHGYK